MKHQREYTYVANNRRHIWAVKGNGHAVHLWINEPPASMPTIDPYGGIEYHYSKCPLWRENKEPDHTTCGFIKGPCWHEGGSMCAEPYCDQFKRGDPIHLEGDARDNIWLMLEGRLEGIEHDLTPLD